MRRFAVIDNLYGHRDGWTTAINSVHGAKVVASLDFPEALERESWDDVDVVVCDMADEPLSAKVAALTGREEEQKVRHLQTDYISIGLIQKIKGSWPNTVVIAVTGHSFVFDNPVLRRAITQARADHFVNRSDFDAIIHHLAGSSCGELDSAIVVMEGPDAPEEIAHLGITRLTDVLSLLEELSKDKWNEFFASPKVTHRLDRLSGLVRSAAEAAARQLKGVTTKGQPAGSVRIPTLRTIKELGTRIPDEYRNRGN